MREFFEVVADHPFVSFFLLFAIGTVLEAAVKAIAILRLR